MSGPHSIVSGGTGLVGRFIVEALLAAGHRVTVIGRNAPREGLFSGAVAFAPMTLEPTSILTTLFEGADFFVHAAFDHLPGRYRGGEGDDAAGFRRRNLEGSIAMFRAARAAGVARTVFLSTRAVYGPRKPGAMLDETDACRPDTLYGEVKLAAEEALSQLSGDGFSGVSLRVTGVYGPAGTGRSHKWESLFEDYLSGREITPRIATEVHGEDVGSAVRILLTSPAEKIASGLFNVSDLTLDRSELLALVARETGSENPLPPAADRDAVNAMKTERLRALGWAPGGWALLERSVPLLLGRR
ncbi:NAD(P)-dependent oxidoreductase [Nitratireductor sp. B36]|uniref:NAD-dependent epimerase/dehydratase family protein n=1 Tax=Nitratireductor sp. B36 TaxID=2762059 RepID=UPI001E5F1012|nr:NAD(P)-dependent oxidoreductase [Nitratireductor sp. B36]MCC5779205.1 NAD(P)-dependent oxidoreductase [Nitratireductor sp. B36]